jgi:glycosyltransferase involved in cell wall biosynthesis
MAAYNAEKTLEQSASSVLAQTLSDLELLIVDDGSTDGTVEAAKAVAARDSRVRVVICARNGGPAAARNAGLDWARGEWIAVVDSDDMVLPRRMEAMAAEAEKAGADIVFDNLLYVRDGRARLYVPEKTGVFGDLPLALFIRSHRRSCPVPNLGFLKPLIRRGAIQRSRARYDTGLQIGEDALLIMTLMAQGAKAYLMREAFYRYHRRPGSISARQGASQLRGIVRAFDLYMHRHFYELPPDAIAALRALRADNARRLQAKDILEGRLSPLAMMEDLKTAGWVMRESAGWIRRGLHSAG